MTTSRFALAAALTLVATSAVAAPPDPSQFPTQEGHDLWRASKLPGIAIYGRDSQRVGKISDVLIDRSGAARYLVIGLGGFLGIGEKDVAVSFGAVTFTDTPLSAQVTATTPAPPGSLAPAGSLTPVGGEAATGTPAAQPNLGGPAAAATPNASPDMKVANDLTRAYPDHGMLDMTKDQLKSAPPFRFAR